MKRAVFCVLVVACMVPLIWIAIDIIQQQRVRAQRDAVRKDLKQLMIAMCQYHDDHGSFPPAYVNGPNGDRWHSWRVLILPYIDPQMAAGYRYDEPWNSPHNSRLAESVPAVFQSENASPGPAATSYFAVIGQNTLWPAWQSLSFRDITDGTSNTLAIVEDRRSDICWLEPRDLRIDEFVHSFYADTTLNDGAGRTAAFADESVSFLGRGLARATLNGLLTPQWSSNTFHNAIWPEELQPILPDQRLYAPRNSATLAFTDIHASALETMTPERNHLWCASFQLAWDRHSLQFGDHEITSALDASPCDPTSLSPDATFNAVTNATQAEDQDLLAEIRTRFPDVEPSVHALRGGSNIRLRLYSLLRKQMPFETKLDCFAGALNFGRSKLPVNSFGIDPETDRENLNGFTRQIEILDDRGNDNCIIRLTTSGQQQDQIILAMVPPADSLLTWENIEERIGSPNPAHARPSLDLYETLRIPIIDFSLKHHFDDLEGLVTSGQPRYVIDLAFMEIRLRLDKTGADLMSAGEAGIIGEFGEPEFDPDRSRNFTFNKPFFVALKEPQAKQPYFLAWIANDELLEPYDQ